MLDTPNEVSEANWLCMCGLVFVWSRVRACSCVVVVKSYRAKRRWSVMHNEFAISAPNSSHKQYEQDTCAQP